MGGMLVMKQITSSMPICQKQVLAEQLSLGLCRGRGLATTTARLSDDKKAAEEKAAAEKAAAAKAAAEKAAAEKAAAEKAAADKAAAEAKAAADAKAAAEAKAAEEIAIRNMKDPIQELFLTSIRAYGSSGGLAAADAATQAELQAELTRVAKQFGGAEGEDMSQFPSLSFEDPEVDPINITAK